ncbi:T9SS type A sorting domain-containing protein [Hymenobacter sp. DG25A]|uniref:T9SS type A sorting domain-containing protein n=1 Tax=Hymenobacter sp. DG25A TaxID=1385663 RepID=UPI0009E6D423|nr:T9SS type A sorting domain-containing protein [Hymenobacter sp. DG25A]
MLTKKSTQTWQIILPFLALFLSFGSRQTAQAQDNSSITGSSVILDLGEGNKIYGGKGGVPAPAFKDANLGTFNITDFSTSLILNGGTITTTESAPDVMTGGRLVYRIRANGTTFNLSSGTINLVQGTPNGNNRTFSFNLANVNVLTGLAAGTYSLSIQFAADGVNTAQGGEDYTLTDPPSVFYRATFTIEGVRPNEGPNSTTWTGGKNDNWFDAENWTQGVPTAAKDATIPDFPSGSTISYPNIYSDAVKPNTTLVTEVINSDGTTSEVTTVVPGYDNSTSGPAMTRNLTMQGTSQNERAITRLIVGQLKVYGNFSNTQDSFIQRDNTLLSFTGTDQSISGSTSGFVNVEIDGGGTKTLIKNFAIQAGGKLTFKSGILATNIAAIDESYVRLIPATVVDGKIIPSARLVGENETTYLRGFVIIDSPAPAGTTQDFGNIGLSTTFIGKDPGTITVTRNTAENAKDINNGANSNPGIRRIFGVRPGVPSGLRATLVFHYLDNETRNLAPNNRTLDESKFSLFLSTGGGNTYAQLGRDALNTTDNTLTKDNVTTFATFTLSEGTITILPVSLSDFNAKRVGANAEITWESVMELNNRGYEVQVSTDGRAFRTLTFVPSASPNSNSLLHYSYTDTEANKAGVRYYRLRQIDLDGTAHFFGPKVLSFAGTASVEARMEAYPNPFHNELRLTIQAAMSGKAKLMLLDMTGRVVLQQTAEVTAGTNDLEMLGLTNLQPGAYMLRVVLPDGKAQNTRILKR